MSDMTVAEATNAGKHVASPGSERWVFVTTSGRHIHATLNWALVEQLAIERPCVTVRPRLLLTEEGES